MKIKSALAVGTLAIGGLVGLGFDISPAHADEWGATGATPSIIQPGTIAQYPDGAVDFNGCIMDAYWQNYFVSFGEVSTVAAICSWNSANYFGNYDWWTTDNGDGTITGHGTGSLPPCLDPPYCPA